MGWHPAALMQAIFVLLVLVMIVAGFATSAGPKTAREWMLVRLVLVFLMWALLGFGWVRG